MACFQNEKFCFQGQILQQIKIRSWSNSVCSSRGNSFRWHFWHIHFLSNNVIMKNKVLSYYGLNSRKSYTVADYLHFPSNKNTNTFFFSLLFWEFWWNLQFWKHITTIGKWITTDFVLSHHARLKVVNRPFYSCVLSCQAFDLEWGWRWPCCVRDQNLVSMITN